MSHSEALAESHRFTGRRLHGSRVRAETRKAEWALLTWSPHLHGVSLPLAVKTSFKDDVFCVQCDLQNVLGGIRSDFPCERFHVSMRVLIWFPVRWCNDLCSDLPSQSCRSLLLLEFQQEPGEPTTNLHYLFYLFKKEQMIKIIHLSSFIKFFYILVSNLFLNVYKTFLPICRT